MVFCTPASSIADVIEAIEELVDEGILTGGQGKALVVKLQGALTKLLDGMTTTEINRLGAFRNQVEDHIQSGELTQEEGQPLLDAVDAIITAVGG